jgi:hypothetical protein
VFALDDSVKGSFDGGVTWQEFEPDAFNCLATSASRPDEVLAGSDVVYQSTDTGRTWSPRASTCGNPFLVFRDPRPPEPLYVWFSSCGFVMSLDDLASYTDAGDPGLPRAMMRLGDNLLLAGEGGFLTSPDGVAWANFPGVAGLGTTAFFGLAASGSVPLASHAVRGVLRFADGALSSAGGLFAHRVDDVSLNPTTGDLTLITHVHQGYGTQGMWPTNYPGIWSLNRQAGGWTNVPAPAFESDVVRDWNNFSGQRMRRDPANSAHLFIVACPGGLFESRDSGATWALNAAGVSECIHDVAFDPDDPTRVFVADGDDTHGKVLVSVDSGRTFSPRVASVPGFASGVLSLHGGALLYLYHDPYNNLGNAVLLNAGGGQVFDQDVGYGGVMLAVADGGVWLGTEDGIWYLPSGGNAFTQRLPTDTASVTSLAQSRGRLWVGLDTQGLRYTADSGATWHDAGCPSQLVTALATDPLDDSLWVATGDLGVLHFSLDRD